MPGWYDVDDAASFRMLEAELDGPPAAISRALDRRARAGDTRRFLRARQRTLARAGLRCSFPSGDAFVSVVIPCLNEQEPIGGVVREVLAQGVDEVIVVDNGSTDRTAEEPAAAGARVVREPRRGYGRACAAGLARRARAAEIVCFLDGDGSDVPAFMPAMVTGRSPPIDADFVIGSRLRGTREPGSMTPQQLVAGRLAGLLLRMTYGVRFTDMSPFRAMRVERLRALGMSEQTYGWNLEMQMRAAAARLRILEIPVDHRCRRGGVSKVSGNPVAGLRAAWQDRRDFPAAGGRAARPAGAAAAPPAARRRLTMRVLLTGGAGFIGRHVLRELIARGHAVRVLDSLRRRRARRRRGKIDRGRRADGSRCARCRRRSMRRCAASTRSCIWPPKSGLASTSAICRTTPRPTMPAPPSFWPAWRAPMSAA